jgi:hypothetical protein
MTAFWSSGQFWQVTALLLGVSPDASSKWHGSLLFVDLFLPSQDL